MTFVSARATEPPKKQGKYMRIQRKHKHTNESTWRRNSFCSSEYRNAKADSGMAAAAIIDDDEDDDDDDDDDDDSAGDDDSRGRDATLPFIRMRRTFSRTASAERPV